MDQTACVPDETWTTRHLPNKSLQCYCWF